VVVVNGHGGNIDGIRLAARAVRRDHGSIVAGVMWSQLAADETARLAQSERYGHACEIETSVAMAVAEGSVRADRIVQPRLRPALEPLTEPPSPRVDRPIWFHEWTADGALGDPRAASRELGEEIVAVAHERALEFARSFALSPLPEAIVR
jgi:creatinine amidohydrolase